MKPRAAALAFAAPLLLTAPALAGPAKGYTAPAVKLSVDTGSAKFQLVRHHDGYYRDYHRGAYYNEFGQTRAQERDLRHQAIRACRRAIKSEAYHIGFRDVDFDDGRRARQIGPRGFVVKFKEVEFEGRRREFERSVSCTVRRGNVKHIEGIPQPGRRGYHGGRKHYGY